MAIVKMKHLRLAAMQSDREALLRLLQGMGCAQVSFSPAATPKISGELPSRSLLKSPPATQ